MDGQEYEKYCAGWLRKHGYKDVSLTKASGDQGIDILAYRHGKLYGFQCKYYDRPVGNKAVQEAYSGAAFYDCDYPAVITNSSFTRNAKQLAEEIDVSLIDHIDPDEKKNHLFLFQYFSIFISFTGIWQFSQYNQHPLTDAANILVWSYLTLITGGLFGLYAGNHLFSNLLAIILDTTYLIMDAGIHVNPDPASLLFWGFVLFTDGLLGIHLIRMMRKKNKREARKMRQEIRQEIKERVNLLGKHLEQFFSDELHCTVTLQEAKHNSKGTSTFVFHSSRDIHEDLPLLEYTLNQYARHDHTNDHYSLSADSPHSFTLQISKIKEN